MGLGRDKRIFTDEWIAKAQKTPESGMEAVVRIYDPRDSLVELVGKEYVTVIEPLLENIPARIQQIRTPAQKQIAVNSTEVQLYRFSMPRDMRIDVSVGMRIEVTSAPHNEELKRIVFVVKGIADSSNPIRWLITCEADLELKHG